MHTLLHYGFKIKNFTDTISSLEAFIGTKVISVLPGSRAQEVKRMLPIFRGAMQHIANKYSDVTAIIPTAQSPIVTDMVAESVKGWEIPVIVLPAASDVEKYDAFAVS